MKIITSILNTLSILVNKLKKILKTAIIISPIIMAVFYIILTFIHQTPPNPLTKKYKYHVSQFMNIHISEAWKLFAPSPVYTSIKLLIKCKDESTWSNWFDPIANIIKQHYNSRFSTSGNLMRQYKYIGDRMKQYIIQEKLIKCKDINSKECKSRRNIINKSEEMKILLKFTEDRCNSRTKKMTEVQYKLIEIHPKPYSKRDNLGNFFKIDIILQGNYKFQKKSISKLKRYKIAK